METLQKISILSDSLYRGSLQLKEDLAQAQAISDTALQARFYEDTILKDLKLMRRDADQLETLTSEEYWPFPTYTRLLYSV